MHDIFNCCINLKNIENDKDTFEYVLETYSDITYNNIKNEIIYRIDNFNKKKIYNMYLEILDNTDKITIKLILLFNLDILKIEIFIKNNFNHTKITIKKNWGDNNNYIKVIDYLLENKNEIKKILQINTQKKILVTNLFHTINYGNYIEKILSAKSLAIYYINNGYILQQNLFDIIKLLKNDIYFIQGYICIALLHIFKNNKHIYTKKNLEILKTFKKHIEKIKILRLNKINTNTHNDLIITFFMSNTANELLNLI